MIHSESLTVVLRCLKMRSDVIMCDLLFSLLSIFVRLEIRQQENSTMKWLSEDFWNRSSFC